jgi:hypothetical protein
MVFDRTLVTIFICVGAGSWSGRRERSLKSAKNYDTILLSISFSDANRHACSSPSLGFPGARGSGMDAGDLVRLAKARDHSVVNIGLLGDGCGPP